jgi:hypothetical protein
VNSRTGRGPILRLLRLILARLNQMRAHQIARALGVARANRLIDAPVHLRRVAMIAFARLNRGLSTPLVIQLRHHLDERSHDRIARRRRHRPMEGDVVDQEALTIVHRREQRRHFFGESRHLLGGATFRGESRGADLEEATCLVHFLAREAVQRRQEAQGLGAERRRPFRNVGARSVAGPHDAQGRERPQAGANGRPAHPDVHREIALGRQPVARPKRAALDLGAHVRHDLIGARPGSLPTSSSIAGHQHTGMANYMWQWRLAAKRETRIGVDVCG